MTTRLARLLLCATIGLASLAAAQPATAPAMPALAALEGGEWTLRIAGEDGARRMCLGDRTALLQVQHAGIACSRHIVANDPQTVTVHYSCPGAGSGRTTVRVETPRLVQIDTQGIRNGAPFADTFEGRHIGSCTTAH
ncbi:hypothetical protein FHS96_000504 [Sphingomonas zeicaulis]|uniref:hypothetical protein n=1 Tax=Sphingomonas zeicaulis TaxID=1632740 RepID=UPI003D22A0AA